MKKVVTLTLSPSLDNTSETDSIYPHGKIRCKAPRLEAGGGGINVARVIKRLGGNCTAIYPCGGATGESLNKLLVDENVNIRPIECRNWTRQNLNVSTRCDMQQYRFIMPGPPLMAEELKAIECAILDEDPEYLVISGSLPEDLDVSYVKHLIDLSVERDIKVIFDSSGPALLDILRFGKLFLVKPNSKELSSISGKSFFRAGDMEAEAMDLVSSGKTQIALVSLGPQGALLVHHDLVEQIVPPKTTTYSTVGAGDSMVGAVLYALSAGFTVQEAARMGVAAGTGATMNEGTALCDCEVVNDIYEALLQRYPL